MIELSDFEIFHSDADGVVTSVVARGTTSSWADDLVAWLQAADPSQTYWSEPVTNLG